MKNIFFISAAISLILLGACAANRTEQSLFQRIGGLPVLTVVISETVNQASTDPKTKRSFEGVNLIKLKESVVNQLCVLTGGGCVYDGENMKNAHADLKISTAEFEIFVQAFREALDRHVATREKNELLKILAPMKRDIVNTNPVVTK